MAHVKPKNDKYITIIYDCKLSGSASARSHIRIVPFRENNCKTSIRGILTAMGSGDSIPENVLFHLLDGGTHGNDGRMLKAFSDNAGKLIPK